MDEIETPYVPSQTFLAWLQKRRPHAANYFSQKQSYPMTVQPQSGRHRIRVPGTHCDIDGATDFDRQIDTAELCLVLDQHPDLYRP